MKLNGFPVEKRKLSDLVKASYNPRQITPKAMTALEQSLKEFGTVEPIVVNKTTGNVVGGHQRLDALLTLGEKETDVVIVEMNTDREKALNLALNKISGEWDDDKLREVFNELGSGDLDLALTGFSEKEIQELLGIADYEGLTDEDEVPEQAEPICKTGELWLLGEHRLLCGDSTKAEDVERLMDGQKASLCVTSPPYWIGKEYEKETTEESIRAFIKSCSDTISLNCFDNARVCINTGIISNSKVLGEVDCRLLLDWWQESLRENNWFTRNIRIWVKHGGLAGISPNQDIVDMHWEFLATFWKKTKDYKGQNRIGEQWALLGFWDDLRGEKQEIHSAPYPVELPSRFIRLYTNETEPVLDPFLGSGSTLIACEKLNRKCYGMEIDPHYCDVIIERWQNFTGKIATRA